MAKKHDWHTGLTGDNFIADPKKEGIPPFLQVQNRRPLTPEAKAKLDETMRKAHPSTERVDWRKPMGMSFEDWDALQNAQALQRNATNQERFTHLQATKPRVPSVRKAAGMLDAHHFAALLKCEAKLVRQALRDKKQTTIKKPKWGWCFTKDDEQRVLDVVSAWLKKQQAKPALTDKAGKELIGKARKHAKAKRARK
jgi:hypothetical protein